MVIIKFCNKKKIEKKKFFRKYMVEEDYFLRYNERIDNTIFTVVETSFDVDNPQILKLVNSNRGLIFKTDNEMFNERYGDALFDSSQYFKKAYYSSFEKILKDDGINTYVFIEDKNFRLTDEAYSLASRCKKLTVMCTGSKYIDEFRYNCFNNYGLSVILKENSCFENSTYILRFPEKISSDYIEYYVGKEVKKLYPDKRYFIFNSECEHLLSYGIAPEDLCAALNK